MKNKKGFTLVELLGAIAILAVLSIVVFTKGFGVLDKTKSGINKIEEENLLEAARVFLVDVDNEIDGVKSEYINTYIKINVKMLEDNGYFTDDGDHCDDTAQLNVMIKQEDGVTIDYIAEKVNPDEVICTK